MLERVLRSRPWRHWASVGVVAGVMCMMPACSDDYEWAEETPSWLGASIYDELARRGNFSIYLKMADELGQSEFLKKTGSVTVFVADDEAYRAYFKAHGMDENNLTPSMKKYLLHSSMLENAYVLDMLTNASEGNSVLKGQVMRRTNTEWSYYDSIPAVSALQLPEPSVSADWWAYLRDKNQPLYNLTDDGIVPMVHFIWRQMMTQGITKSDFSYLFNGTDFQEDDVYINNVRVREGNVTCQNGYIHIMDDVPAPLPNMAEYLRTNGNTKLFSKLIDRFSAPFADAGMTAAYAYYQNYYAGQNLYPALLGGDSIYVRRYFYSSADGSNFTSFNGKQVDATLKFDPSQNDYAEADNVQEDMGAIFAPTDEALTNYWNGDGGTFLRERYPSEEPFENVPNSVLAEFLNNHMQYSFLSSLPSRFPTVLDDAKEPINLDEGDITTGTQVCNNGAVYVMRNVYAPASFRSVLAPTLVNEDMKVMAWAIDYLDFRPYLLSMVSYYDFLILTDKALSRYIDPVSYSTNNPRWFRFYFDEATQTVQAYSYRYDKTVGGFEGCTEEDVQLLNSVLTTPDDGTPAYYTPNAVVTDRLEDLLNFCIIPRDVLGGNYVGNGSEYFQTKDDGATHIRQSAGSVTVEDQFSGQEVPARDVVETDNGKYYVLDQMVQPTFRSLTAELSSHEEYSEFYKLLQGNENWTPVQETMYAQLRQSGSNYSMNDDNTTVRFFNSYYYTVYVPDNEAMQKAYDLGLPTWDDINALADQYAGTDVNVDSMQTAWTQRLLNFLKYHFQTNSIYIGGDPRDGNYETAAFYSDGPQEGLCYTLKVQSDASHISVVDNSELTQDVTIRPDAEGAYYNRMIREYSFGESDGNAMKSASDLISTSSYAVVHRISEPLIYDDECLLMREGGATGN